LQLGAEVISKTIMQRKAAQPLYHPFSISKQECLNMHTKQIHADSQCNIWSCYLQREICYVEWISQWLKH